MLRIALLPLSFADRSVSPLRSPPVTAEFPSRGRPLPGKPGPAPSSPAGLLVPPLLEWALRRALGLEIPASERENQRWSRGAAYHLPAGQRGPGCRSGGGPGEEPRSRRRVRREGRDGRRLLSGGAGDPCAPRSRAPASRPRPPCLTTSPGRQSPGPPGAPPSFSSHSPSDRPPPPAGLAASGESSLRLLHTRTRLLLGKASPRSLSSLRRRGRQD